MSFSKKLLFTGERASLSDIGGINLARYRFALPFAKRRRVLELGCGSGYGTFFLAKNGARELLAYDANRSAINFAKANFGSNKITYECERIEDIKNIGKFDVIVALEIIEHLTRPENLLKLAKFSLEKGGYFIVSTPNRLQSSYDGDKPSNPYHVKEYFPQEFFVLLKKYFRQIGLYGIFLSDSKIGEEKKVQKSWRWKIASYVTRKRWVRRLVNYLPESPKRLFTGERGLNFKPEDFKFSKRNLEKAPYLIAVCRL